MSPSMSPALGGDAISICLFLPYLHFDSYKRLIRRRSVILQRLRRGRARPIPEEIAKSDSTELQVIWEFLGHDPPMNCRRTLDQYGYPSLRDTRGRDDDQMLYKLTKERTCNHEEHRGGMYAHSSNSRGGSYGSGASWREKEKMAGLDNLAAEDDKDDDGVLNGNVLMVDQLWLWVINSRRSCPSTFSRYGITNRISRHSHIILPQARGRPHRRSALPTGRPSRQHLQ